MYAAFRVLSAALSIMLMTLNEERQQFLQTYCCRAWRASSIRVSTSEPRDSVPKLGPSANLAERSVLPFSALLASGGAKYLHAHTFSGGVQGCRGPRYTALRRQDE